MLCFKTQMGSKESSISFLSVEKEEKKLLAEQRFASRTSNWLVNLHCGTLVPFRKEAKEATFLKIFRYNLHINNGQGNSVFKWKYKCL